MTDAETFAAICADFPFSTSTLDALHVRLDALLRRTENRAPKGGRDGTIDEAGRKRLQYLTWTIRDLVRTMQLIEQDGDPDTWIPF